jgi:hypothetical protein
VRLDLNTCRDPDLLAAEVRRLEGVIAAGQPAMTDEERDALKFAIKQLKYIRADKAAAPLVALLERMR